MKQRAGFTIIELLVVIVVIAILAAISIVAYTGIQERARNAQLLSAFDSYEKALRQYKILNGTYPITAGNLPSGVFYACLGGPFPVDTPFATDECYKGDSNTYGVRSAALDTAIKTTMATVPVTSNKISWQNTGTTYTSRGILYGSSGPTALLFYIIKENQECGRGAKYAAVIDGVSLTQCMLSLD